MLFSHKWKGGSAGGTETHVTDLIKELSRRGHQVVLATDGICAGIPSRSPNGVVAHFELPFRSINPFEKLRVYKELVEVVTRHKTDIIHAHHRTAGYYAERLCRKKQIPYVVTVHDTWHSVPFKALHGNAFRNLIAVSEFIKRALVLRFHVPVERVRTIYNGVDPTRFQGVDPENALRFRQKHGARFGEVVISLVGRISRAKGHYDLLEALRRLPKDLPYRCFIVGEGKDQGALQRLACASAVADKVSFCRYQPNIPLVMSASDIVVLPAHREAFGLTIVEAMLSRRPVIASDAGGIPEIITHNRDGMLFRAGDVSGLAECIANLVADQELRSRLAEEAYRTATKRFLLRNMVDETEQHYCTLIQG